MGIGRDSDLWTDDEEIARVKEDIATALRKFYFCGHPWSFLKPAAVLYLASGDTTVPLPDDFCGVDAGTTVSVINSSEVALYSLRFAGHGVVQHSIDEFHGSSGPPEKVAIRPLKQKANGRIQASELVVCPTADAAYTLKFPYYVVPDYFVDTTMPYACGGVEHHETIMEMALAAAELRRDGVKGMHSAEAQQLLQSSIKMDRMRQPKTLGYNGDRSDGMNSEPSDGRGLVPAQGYTINGVLFD